MKAVLPERLENGRVRSGEFASDSTYGPYGKFFVRGPQRDMLCIIASGGDVGDEISLGWEHVSISAARRTPLWSEMCFVKDLFWDPEETVIQFHPPKSEYINNHPFVLHLWRHKTIAFQLPPSIMVGDKTKGLLSPALRRPRYGR